MVTTAPSEPPLTDLPVVSPIKQKWDWNIIFFFLNVVMVVISYGAAGFTKMASNIITKPLRIGLLAFSLYYLFSHTKKFSYYFKGKNSWALWLFIWLNLCVIPFSYSFFTSIEKWANLIPFMIYINYFIIYLFRNFDKEYVLSFLLNVLNIVYVIPIVSFIFLGGSLDESDIYGEVVGGFANNHYGWASSVFLSTGMDIYRNNKSLSKLRKWLLLGLSIVALFILAISGSRSGYLTFALSFLILITRNQNIKLFVKFFITILVFLFVAQLYGDPNSALNKRLDKSEKQLKSGEARQKIANLGWQTMDNNPQIILTGYGFYAFKEGVLALNPRANPEDLRISLHNSYYELIFGCGILVFTLFLIFFVGKTLFWFIIRHSKRFVFLPPLILIPMFENNFNPGQFLFFPWFIIMFYYLHYPEKQIPAFEIPDRFNGKSTMPAQVR
jgi:O-antigen ligase